MSAYCPAAIESQCQAKWEREDAYRADESSDKPKYYCLSMYPYPSGAIHMGHVRNYALSDVDARFHRLLGYNVLHPIGWDSFGLPAENAALLHQISPKIWTENNIAQMKKSFKRLGYSFDWSRELASHDPAHYQWEQKLFLRLLEEKLAYQKEKLVYWCPTDETVLANEQVENGLCWRCSNPVETRRLNQWFLKLSQFSEALLEGLDELDEWPKEVKNMQRHWIGRKSGYQLEVELKSIDASVHPSTRQLALFIEHLELIFGASHVSMTIEHPLILELMRQSAKWEKTIQEFIQSAGLAQAHQAHRENPGVRLPFAILHPFTQVHLPLILVANLATGEALLPWMAIAAHYSADFQVAQALELPYVEVVLQEKLQSKKTFTEYDSAAKAQLINSERFSNQTSGAAKAAMLADLKARQIFCESKTVYRVKDWGVSRQRYWGAPIPMLQDESGVLIAEQLEALPVELPEFESIEATKERNLLENSQNWRKLTREGRSFQRLCETFDTFVQSSWYYARYCAPHDTSQMIDSEAANYWLPIDHYIGGVEHATMHLIYFRFFHKLLKHYNFVESDEPVKRLTCQGMVLADSFYTFSEDGSKIWLPPAQVSITRDATGKISAATDALGRNVYHGGCSKMSKSKNNGIDPESMIDQYGADAVRFFILFAAPPQLQVTWSEEGVIGASRFLTRLWNLSQQLQENPSEGVFESPEFKTQRQALIEKRNWCIEKVTQAYGPRFAINVGIAAIMEFFNDFSKSVQAFPALYSEHQKSLKILLKLLHPVVPHIAESLWEQFSTDSLIDSGWPTLEKQEHETFRKELVVQLNGKKIGCLPFLASLTQTELIEMAFKDAQIARRLSKIEVQKSIYVAGKILNFIEKKAH